jgi:hypothetical protein
VIDKLKEDIYKRAPNTLAGFDYMHLTLTGVCCHYNEVEERIETGQYRPAPKRSSVEIGAYVRLKK